jgi:dipeptidyl aminopeptidase/acylaminoacyl peptidase
VTGPIEGVDEERGFMSALPHLFHFLIYLLVYSYFRAANPSTIHRHIFSVPLPDHALAAVGSGGGFTPAALTNTSELGWYSASFSPECGFYVLKYDGPDIPSQRVLSINDESKHSSSTGNPRSIANIKLSPSF